MISMIKTSSTPIETTVLMFWINLIGFNDSQPNHFPSLSAFTTELYMDLIFIPCCAFKLQYSFVSRVVDETVYRHPVLASLIAVEQCVEEYYNHIWKFIGMCYKTNNFGIDGAYAQFENINTCITAMAVINQYIFYPAFSIEPDTIASLIPKPPGIHVVDTNLQPQQGRYTLNDLWMIVIMIIKLISMTGKILASINAKAMDICLKDFKFNDI